MVIVKIRDDGTIIETVRKRYFQNSNKSQYITLFCPFDDSFGVLVNFELPDGYDYSGFMVFKNWENDGYYAWQIPVTSNITKIPGRLKISFSITKEGKIIKTPNTHLLIEESIGDGDGGIIDDDDPTTIDELFVFIEQKIEEKIERISGKSKVWTEENEPDSEVYDTWFRPIDLEEIEKEMIPLMDGLPEIHRNYYESKEIHRSYICTLPEIHR